MYTIILGSFSFSIFIHLGWPLFFFSRSLIFNLLALLTDDSRLDASSRAIIAAMEKSVAAPAAVLLDVVFVVVVALVCVGKTTPPALHRYGCEPTSIFALLVLLLMLLLFRKLILFKLFLSIFKWKIKNASYQRVITFLSWNFDSFFSLLVDFHVLL